MIMNDRQLKTWCIAGQLSSQRMKLAMKKVLAPVGAETSDSRSEVHHQENLELYRPELEGVSAWF